MACLLKMMREKKFLSRTYSNTLYFSYPKSSFICPGCGFCWHYSWTAWSITPCSNGPSEGMRENLSHSKRMALTSSTIFWFMLFGLPLCLCSQKITSWVALCPWSSFYWWIKHYSISFLGSSSRVRKMGISILTISGWLDFSLSFSSACLKMVKMGKLSMLLSAWSILILFLWLKE